MIHGREIESRQWIVERSMNDKQSGKARLRYPEKQRVRGEDGMCLPEGFWEG